MRIIPYPFKRAETIHVDHLKDLARHVKKAAQLHDQIEDIYAYLLDKGGNILTQDQIRKGIEDNYTEMETFERVNYGVKHMEFFEFLTKLNKLTAFATFCDHPEHFSTLLVMALFRITLNNMAAASGQGQGGAGTSVNDIDISGVEEFMDSINDGDMQDLVQDIETFNGAFSTLTEIMELLDDGTKPKGLPGTAHTAIQHKRYWTDRIVHFVNNFDLEKTSIYQCARNLDSFVDAVAKTKTYSNDRSPEDVQNIDVSVGKDLQNAAPIELCQEDDVLFKRMAQGELQQRVYQNPRDKKQCFYILEDCSGSMSGQPHNMATAISVSICRKAIKDDERVFFRLFDHQPHARFDGITTGLIKKLEAELLTAPFSGGGTSIANAVHAAVKDIEDFRKDPASDIGKADILLLSDGDDSYDPTPIRDKLTKLGIKLHVIIITTHYQGYEQSKDYLKNSADSLVYASADEHGALAVMEDVLTPKP